MNTYRYHCFPPDIISYAVWLYYRFNLSLDFPGFARHPIAVGLKIIPERNAILHSLIRRGSERRWQTRISIFSIEGSLNILLISQVFSPDRYKKFVFGHPHVKVNEALRIVVSIRDDAVDRSLGTPGPG